MNEVEVSKHNNILLIGPAANNNHLKEVVYADRYEDVLKEYGDSKLTDAFKLAKDLGAPYVFLLNLRYNYQFFDVAEMLAQNDFAYIVPVTAYMSDVFDEEKSERRISYIEYLLEQIARRNNSTVIATDKHAALYEDLDTYLDAMNEVDEDFRYNLSYKVNPENIVFVLNNLKDHDMANVALAAAICQTAFKDYPTAAFGEAIFNIDAYEDIGNFAYFMNHTVRETTVENLVNYCGGVPQRAFTIDRIVKAIAREIDFSELIGEHYSAVQLVTLEKKLDKYLSSIVGSMIYNYQINSVSPYRAEESGIIYLETKFDVWPISSFEKVHIDRDIEVS